MKDTDETAPVHLPIEDVLDLHTFRPEEVPDLLDDYMRACVEANIFSIRIIHGKGTGTLRKRVRGILEKHPLVAGYRDAPADAGGWGATLATLKKQ